MTIDTKSHLAFILKVREKEFVNIVRKIDLYYYERAKLKFNKDGTPNKDKNGNQRKRILNPSRNRLKIIQQRINQHILSKLILPDYAYGAVKKRDNVKNARKHQGKKFVFTTDLIDFFPSIRHYHVFEMFRSLNFSPSVSRILTQLTTYKGKLPQGTPTSPAIANLVFAKTGKKLQHFSNQNTLTFTSFIDDLTFSSSKNFKPKVQLIIDILKTDGFQISHKKTNYKTKNPLITGVIVKNNQLALPAIYKDKLKNTLGLSLEQLRGLYQYAEKVKTA